MQEAMAELLAEFGCDAAEGKVMDAAELREQADTAAEQQAEGLKEKLAAERPAPEETLSFYVAECLEFTFAGEFHDHLTMEEALEVYDKIPSERMSADKCIGFCIEEDGGFVGMYELVVNDKVQRENINSINYFRDDKNGLTRFAYKNASAIACGEEVKTNLVDYYHLSKDKVAVIHNAVKPYMESIKPDAYLKKLKEDGYIIVGNIGRLSEQKGMEYFIDSYKKVHESIDKLKYVVVGQGEDEQSLKRKVEEEYNQDNIVF